MYKYKKQLYNNLYTNIEVYEEFIMSIMMSPDEYIIVDPCYVMPDKAYQAMVDSVFSSNNELDNVYVYKGKQMVVFGTAYGDGGYSNNINANSILVDSGLIACIPTSVLAKKSIKDNSKNSVVFTAKSSITCQNDDGILQYGAITVDTVGHDDDDADTYDDSYDDEDDDDCHDNDYFGPY